MLGYVTASVACRWVSLVEVVMRMFFQGFSSVPDALRHLCVFSCLNVDDAPEEPGLYAWYGLLNAGECDWKMLLVEGEDRGNDASRNLLQRHTARSSSPPLKLQARGTFSAHWTGELRDASSERLTAVLWGKHMNIQQDLGASDDDKYHQKLQEVLLSEKLREKLFFILQVATPILSAPIYIGVATNLRIRLKQHTDALFKLAHASPNELSAEDRKRLIEDGRFAARAIGMGFSPDNLSVWTLGLDAVYSGGENTEVLRKVAETAEWLLNRWHKPLLGRR